jgi:hypothetical protein
MHDKVIQLNSRISALISREKNLSVGLIKGKDEIKSFYFNQRHPSHQFFLYIIIIIIILLIIRVIQINFKIYE